MVSLRWLPGWRCRVRNDWHHDFDLVVLRLVYQGNGLRRTGAGYAASSRVLVGVLYKCRRVKGTW